MLLPTFPVQPFDAYNNYDETCVYPYLHPRTAANLQSGYARLYFWPGMYSHPALSDFPMTNIIEDAVSKRDSHGHLISNAHPQYSRNLP